MKIVQLTASNVKRLRAVTIKPDGSLVVIGGDNANGKTSVLDSIQMAIGGKAAIPEQPIRRGEKKAEIILDLGDYIVTRTMHLGKDPQLVVTNKAGSKLSSPQGILDALTSRVAFDPLEFMRMEPKKQAETLRQLVGIDFSALDAKRKTLYDERMIVNREADSKQAVFANMPQHADAPKEEVSVADLSEKLKEANAANNANAQERLRLGTLKDNIDRARAYEEEAQGELDAAKAALEKAQTAFKEAEKARILAENTAAHFETDAIAKLADVDTQPILEEISNVESTNRKVRENAARVTAEKELKAKRMKSESLTEQIDEIDAAKQKQLTDSKFPVPGLSFDETGVQYQGLPLAQASGAEMLRVSVATGLAMNPTLKVLLIRDGSLLDETNLAMIHDMATASEAQIWIERVGDGDECSVIIEDGAVAEDRTEKGGAK